jgi:hypothetical protein
VLQELIAEANDLERRALRPAIVGDFPDGSIRELVHLRLYPGLSAHPNADLGRYDVDLGRFQANPPWEKPGLELAPMPATGEAVVTAGFPVASTEITYPTGPGAPRRILPTVRSGRIERVTGLDTQATAVPSLIQHDLLLAGGFSGAPLVDREGRLLGVVTATSHVHIGIGGTGGEVGQDPTLNASMRTIDPGGFGFAVSATYFASGPFECK